MALSWTTEKIIALSPDAASTKAGQALSNVRKWVTLGHNDEVAWGECQGSGKNPYQTQIDLKEPAFKCSCPSRKFPCKHGLGLFLLLASDETVFTQNDVPSWVAQWLESRGERARKKGESAPREVDEAAQAKRALEREKKVARGLHDLELWLHDLVRGGLSGAPSQPPTFWETPSARLVDVQAASAARLVRELSSVAASGEGWTARLVEKLSRLHLMIEGYKQLETLDSAMQTDIRALVGWPQKESDVLTAPGVRDHWAVLAQSVEDKDRLRVQRTWLWGEKTNRPALLLQFAATGQNFDVGLVPNTLVEAELAFYKSNFSLRALVKERFSSVPSIPNYENGCSIAQANATYVQALSRQPWIERFPFWLHAVVPLRLNEVWIVRDENRHYLPLSPRSDKGWRLMAQSGGHPIALFGEWNGDYLTPLHWWPGQMESSTRMANLAVAASALEEVSA